jgi:hypothetical protein
MNNKIRESCGQVALQTTLFTAPTHYLPHHPFNKHPKIKNVLIRTQSK